MTRHDRPVGRPNQRTDNRTTRRGGPVGAPINLWSPAMDDYLAILAAREAATVCRCGSVPVGHGRLCVCCACWCARYGGPCRCGSCAAVGVAS